MPSYMCINNCSKVCTNYISSLLKSWNWYPCRVKARKASRSDVICNCVLVLVHIFASFFFLCRSPSEHTFLGHNLNSYSHLVKTKISCAIVSTTQRSRATKATACLHFWEAIILHRVMKSWRVRPSCLLPIWFVVGSLLKEDFKCSD